MSEPKEMKRTRSICVLWETCIFRVTIALHRSWYLSYPTVSRVLPPGNWGSSGKQGADVCNPGWFTVLIIMPLPCYFSQHCLHALKSGRNQMILFNGISTPQRYYFEKNVGWFLLILYHYSFWFKWAFIWLMVVLSTGCAITVDHAFNYYVHSMYWNCPTSFSIARIQLSSLRVVINQDYSPAGKGNLLYWSCPMRIALLIDLLTHIVL